MNYAHPRIDTCAFFCTAQDQWVDPIKTRQERFGKHVKLWGSFKLNLLTSRVYTIQPLHIKYWSTNIHIYIGITYLFVLWRRESGKQLGAYLYWGLGEERTDIRWAISELAHGLNKRESISSPIHTNNVDEGISTAGYCIQVAVSPII